MVRDADAYTLSMVSRYSSSPLPKMPLTGVGDDMGIRVLKDRERTEDLVRFWS